MRTLLVAAALVGSPVIASADVAFDPLSMDRHMPGSRINLDLGYEVWDDANGTDTTVMGLNIGGQFVGRTGLGGYANIPLSYIGIENLLLDDSELAIGNIEAGLVYTKWFRGNTAMVFHGGVALPTADDDGPGAFQAFASVPRYGDLVQRVPDSTWLRFGVSPMGRGGILFWRADIGLDLALDEDSSNLSPIFRINVGGGVDLGGAQLLAELVTNIVDEQGNDDSASTLALGARFVSGNLRPGIGLLLPIGFENFDALEFAVIGSLAVHLAR